MALNVKGLIALADRLDKEGKADEADRIDALVKKIVADEVDLPEHQPVDESITPENVPGAREFGQQKSGPPEEIVPGAREKSSPIPDMAEGFLAEPTKEKFDELVEALGEYMKFSDEFSEEGGVVASKVDKFKKSAYEHIDRDEDLGDIDWVDHILNFLDFYFKNPHKNNLANLQKLLENFQAQFGNDDATEGVLPPPAEEQFMDLASNKEVFSKLATLADRLDKVGAIEEANLVDGFIRKHAEDFLDYQGEGDTEQSKRYDSKHHHSLQVREPKTKQERVDREGREEHHVHTQQHVAASGLSTRYCPEHVGITMGRVGENTYQCPLDGSVFNWETGWTDHDGNEHPGGSVAAQTPDSSGYAIPHRIFDSRENISNRVN